MHCVHAFSHVHASSALAEGWLVVCVLHYRYLASFSWSIMIITGTGGTDFYPSSLSNAETLIVVSLVIFGALLWTQVHLYMYMCMYVYMYGEQC